MSRKRCVVTERCFFFFSDQEKAATHIPILTPLAFQLYAEEFQNASYGAKECPIGKSLLVLIRSMDAGDDAPSQKEISHVLVRLLLQGTLKQFNVSFLAHAKGQINALKFFQNYEHHTVAQRKEGNPSLHKHTMPDIKTFEGNWPA